MYWHLIKGTGFNSFVSPFDYEILGLIMIDAFATFAYNHIFIRKTKHVTIHKRSVYSKNVLVEHFYNKAGHFSVFCLKIGISIGSQFSKLNYNWILVSLWIYLHFIYFD